VSDHEAADPSRPLWRRFKQREVFDEPRIVRLLSHLRELGGGRPVELILNGDVFDFDTVIAVPTDAPAFEVSWLESTRGLHPEEAKSAWKMRRILDHHPGLVEALRAWVAEGHELVFVIGNHDLELHWPAVQEALRARVAPDHPERLVVCELFRLSGGDTLVTHGNQFDAYCVCQDPVEPWVRNAGRTRVRMPFGNHCTRYIANGMGLINPHADSAFIRPIGEYIRFFVRDVMRTQPLLAWTWAWTAPLALAASLVDGWGPTLRDPAALEAREEAVAQRAGASARMVRALRAVAVHPAVFEPWRLARELWVDRAALAALVVLVTFQLFAAFHFVTGAGAAWALPIFGLLLGPFLAYARSCRSEVGSVEVNIREHVPLLARIAGVTRVVMGHTHRPRHERVGSVEYLNTGHWSPAFEDVACTRRMGRDTFAWVDASGAASLRAWDGHESFPLTAESDAAAHVGAA
jgi:UDP-2,3-diacylglucosamine pyrophosphatase LpxH